MQSSPSTGCGSSLRGEVGMGQPPLQSPSVHTEAGKFPSDYSQFRLGYLCKCESLLLLAFFLKLMSLIGSLCC